jgi:hypothetical protein
VNEYLRTVLVELNKEHRTLWQQPVGFEVDLNEELE